MNYTSISIQGNILSSEIFEKIRLEDARFQNAKDFGLNPSASVRDEINNAWSLALTNWQIFKQKREALGTVDTGTTETRKNWMLPLLHILGFEAGTAAAELVNNKSYAVSHRASNKDGFPIHIVGINQSLDKRADAGGARLSPHALIQEYINNTEHLYGITSNGAMLRVLRDATRLSRLSYVEFNLEQMMEEGLFTEFALLYRTLHASRFADKKEENADSIFEWYHQEALSSGSRIREKLSSAVEHSILLLANGLLEHPNNQELRTQLAESRISAQQYYLFVLRTVYRILFLLVIEERKLIYPEKLDAATQRKRDIYFRYYSIQRLSKLIEKNIYIDPKKTDLWQSLVTTFRLFEYKDMGSKLGISALGSGIFQPTALGGVKDQLLSNETLLKVLQYLLTFQNDNGQLVRVNYADLDVEEFGSIYEGLLEYAPEVKNDHFNFVKGNERSSSGSHYTPEELVKPLITHSLDYLIADKLKEADPEAGLLSLTICDVACGSGHILLSAARRVGFELAKVRSGEDQPTPSVLRIAIRDVIKNCIYGVDLNPLAVELCKVALWLEAHEPGQPLNFLDHHIKCGNAIVGLAHYEEIRNGIASEAFKTLPGDDKDIAAALRKKNEAERKSQVSELFAIEAAEHNLQEIQKAFAEFTQLKEDTAEQIAAKALAYEKLTTGREWFRLKQLADIQVAQFFIPKTLANKDRLTTYAKYKNYVTTGQQILDQGASMAVSAEKRFFHWFLEFPHIFMKGGFDCILGNPPFLGDRRLKEAYGVEFLEWIRYKFTEGATVDLVVYFFLRINSILKINGFQSLISTNTVAQGKAREFGLDCIIANGSLINFATKTMKWPGLAAVEVSLVCIFKGNVFNHQKILNGKVVDSINSFFDDQQTYNLPLKLFRNLDKSFQGSLVLGRGFILNKGEAAKLLINAKNKIVVKKYLNGDPLLSDPNQEPNRWVIDFKDMPLQRADNILWESLDDLERDTHKRLGTLVEPFYKDYVAADFEDCLRIIEERVKPERTRLKTDSKNIPIENQFQLRYPLPIRWWRFCETRPKLYKTISQASKVLVSCRVSYYVNSIFVDNSYVYDVTTNVVARFTYREFAFLQSSLHEYWAWKYASTMRFAIRYTNGDCIDTFPIIEDNSTQNKVENIGENYHLNRQLLMTNINLGLTKTYNLFHSIAVTSSATNEKDKQIVSLQKHLAKTEGTVSLEQAVEGIIKLRQLHKEMDEAVLEAYGWSDISLRHGFYEVDYLPENDRVRYTIHPDARKEVLKRLLELNHKIHAEEVAAGLWDKKKPAKKDSAPKSAKSKTAKAVAKDTGYQSPELFEQANLFNQASTVTENCRVTVKNTEGKIFRYHITLKAEKGMLTGDYKQIDPTSKLAQLLIGKTVGETIDFAKDVYMVEEIH